MAKIKNKEKFLSKNKYISDIMYLAVRNPTISEAMETFIEDDDVSWDDTLSQLVINLARQNSAMADLLDQNGIKVKLLTKHPVIDTIQ